MKNNNKILVLLLVVVMTLSVFAGCAGKTEEDNVTGPNQPNEEVTKEIDEADEADEADEVEQSGEVVSKEPVPVEELGTGDIKWSEEETAYGFNRVNNDGGEVLSYSSGSGVKLIQVDGFAFKDLNKNNLLDQYEDWREPAQARAESLAGLMPIEDIAGLMQVSSHFFGISEELGEQDLAFIQDNNGRSVFNAAAGAGTEVTAKWVNSAQALVEGTELGIPINFNVMPRSFTKTSQAYVEGEAGTLSLWPSDLAMAATFDPSLTLGFGKISSEELRAMGMGSYFTSQIDLATEPRWIRVSGTFGEDPALSRDMTSATSAGLQSTFDENGNDIGWGDDSINSMLKHWPGDGAAEGGRESHTYGGKYQVYPGGQFRTHLIPFVDGGFDLPSETEAATAIMISYSIAWSDDGAYGQDVASAYSEFKINDILRDQYGYDGVACTDWFVTKSDGDAILAMPWGTEDFTEVERIYKVIMAGADQIGGNNEISPILEAYEIGVDLIGEEAIRDRFEQSAVRILRNTFRLSLFENQYVDVDEAMEIVGNADFMSKGFEAQLKSVVMVKNEGNVIGEANASMEKPIVYIPRVFKPFTKGVFGPSPATWDLPVNIAVAGKYFNVLTDTISEPLTGPVDKDGNPTVSINDIVRATAEELAECDYAIPVIDSPSNVGSQFDGVGINRETDQYIPLSLQYRPYTADSEFVRIESIAGDMVEVESETTYGTFTEEVKENRSYYGNTSQITNEGHLDTVLYAVENVPTDTPIITVVRVNNPMIFSEFENEVDAILLGFGISDQAIFEVITGKFEPRGLLPLQMPIDMETVEKQFEDVPRDMECYVDSQGNTYDFTFGLNWSGVIADERVQKYNVPALVAPANQGK